MDKLMLCALLSKAVYGKDAPDNLGMIGFEHIVDVDTDTFATAYIFENEIVIAVRGSESKRDWLNDFKIIKTMFFGVKAHRGFSECAGSILSKIGAILKEFPDKDVTLTGHSLGGAIATLIAVSLRPKRVELITFGQPRVSTKHELNLALLGS